MVVASGATETCTITNDDKAGTLIVKKLVINDDGGSKIATDFAFEVDGGSSTSFIQDGADTLKGKNTLTVDAGSYSVVETGTPIAGYATTYDNCTDVVVASGATETCTITNDDKQATLTLKKTVSGGTATEADFDPYIDADLVTWGTPVDLVPGSYTASEIMNVSDYVAGDWGGDCDAQGDVDLALGESLTCTITNYYAELEIVKSADPSFYAEVGDVISYTITATNTGMATLTDVDVSDKFPGGLDGWTCDPTTPATLAPGEEITCTATHTITPADIEAGSVFNQACVDADETSKEVCDDETVKLSELEIVKEADVDFYSAVGDVINYTITATNTGETALSNVDISDNLMADLDGWTCDPTLVVDDLQPGETIVCTASYTIVQADIVAGTVFNQACTDSDETPEVCDDVTTPLAELEIVKEAAPDTYSAVGDEIVYTVTATNTGVATLTDVDITDALIDGLADWTCKVGDTTVTMPVAQLISSQSIVCTATYTVTEDDVTGTDPEGFITNTACADSDQTDEVCDEVITREIVIELIKTVTPDVLAEPGGIFTYTLFIDNESAVPVEITALVDDNSVESADWAANCAVLVGTTLAPDAPGDADSVTCTYTVERTVAGIYPNTANVTAVDKNGTEATAKDDATVRVLRSELEIVKHRDHRTYSAVGDEIVYTITATNTGEATLTNVDITDDLIDGLDDWSCDPGNPVATLAPGESIVCTATYTITQADMDAGQVFNQACADSDQTPEVCDSVTVYPISVVIVKTPSVNVADSGDKVTFTLDYSHPSRLSLYAYSLVDDVFGDLFDADNPNVTANSCADGFGQELLPDTWYRCEFTAKVYGTVNKPHVNTVTITASDHESVSEPPVVCWPRFVSASDDATVKFRGGGGESGGGGKSTDMLPVTDSLAVDETGNPFGGPLSWAVWVLLSALLIVSSGWAIRRQRFAEATNRR